MLKEDNEPEYDIFYFSALYDYTVTELQLVLDNFLLVLDNCDSVN